MTPGMSVQGEADDKLLSSGQSAMEPSAEVTVCSRRCVELMKNTPHHEVVSPDGRVISVPIARNVSAGVFVVKNCLNGHVHTAARVETAWQRSKMTATLMPNSGGEGGQNSTHWSRCTQTSRRLSLPC